MGKLHLLRFSLDCTYVRTTCTNPWAFGVRGHPAGLPALDLLAGKRLSARCQMVRYWGCELALGLAAG